MLVTFLVATRDHTCRVCWLHCYRVSSIYHQTTLTFSCSSHRRAVLQPDLGEHLHTDVAKPVITPVCSSQI